MTRTIITAIAFIIVAANLCFTVLNWMRPIENEQKIKSLTVDMFATRDSLNYALKEIDSLSIGISVMQDSLYFKDTYIQNLERIIGYKFEASDGQAKSPEVKKPTGNVAPPPSIKGIKSMLHGNN